MVVEPMEKKEGGAWELFWDEGDDLLEGKKGALGGRKVLRVSLERTFIEPPREVKKEEKKT